MKSFLSYCILLLFATCTLAAKAFPEKGMPVLENFTPNQYLNAGKIWDIQSAPNGIVYMAADKGLLEYDGNSWNWFKGSNGITRSVLVVNDSLIFTGSDMDFGIWEKNNTLAFEYNSLYPFREDAQDISEEFWNVYQIDNAIAFISSRNIYLLRDQQIIKMEAPGVITGGFVSNGMLYVADEEKGVFQMDDFSLELVFSYPPNERLHVTGIYHHAQGINIVTRDQGMFQFASGQLTRLNHQLSEILKTAIVFGIEPIGHTLIAYGTVLKGLFIADPEGKIIHQINRNKGLPGNTVLSLHASPNGTVWMGLDHGISYLDLKRNITTVYDYMGDFGTGYTSLLKDNVFYLGTNQGLYVTGWDELNNDRESFKFQLVRGTEGQVWTLEDIEGDILMGHDKGLFLVKERQIQQLSNQEGVWTIAPYKEFLLTGNYNGISQFRKTEDIWTFEKKLDLIKGSCNQIIIEKENILWVGIPKYGIIRARLDDDLNPVDRRIFEEHTFQGNDPFLYLSDQTMYVITDQSQYIFIPEEHKFARQLRTMSMPAIDGMLADVHGPVIINDKYDFFPVYNGFVFTYKQERESFEAPQASLVIRKTEAFNNHETALFHHGTKIPNHLNNVRITCFIPNQQDFLYQYSINDTLNWSFPEDKKTFDILGLKHGTHTIFIRAIFNESIVDTKAISLKIAPPWYHSWYAYLLYVLLAGVFIFSVRSLQKLSLKKQRKEMLIKERQSLQEQAKKYQQQLLLVEKKRLQTEFDQLKQQLRNKTIELAKKAREDEEKNRLLLSLKEKCDKAQRNPMVSNIQWSEMKKMLDTYLSTEDNTFDIQMDELHQELFKKLKKNFPDLSANDLRLCAYIKIGLSSKEIADILNIQPSSAYISRSRLRKKLQLKAEEDLYGFLNAY